MLFDSQIMRETRDPAGLNPRNNHKNSITPSAGEQHGRPQGYIKAWSCKGSNQPKKSTTTTMVPNNNPAEGKKWRLPYAAAAS